jgi:hypothetical protein
MDAVLFKQRFWAGLADGSITLTFRSWSRPQVKPGRAYRSPAGMLVVDAIDEVAVADITDDEAQRAGFADRAELVGQLHDPAADHVYRIELHHGGADPREALRADDDLSPPDVEALTKRLDRLDRASSSGPWTRVTLRLIDEHPARRAGDLAAMVGRELAPFKLDVRKLKALGLTESLDVGYRLSPRGRTLLEALDRA